MSDESQSTSASNSSAATTVNTTQSATATAKEETSEYKYMTTRDIYIQGQSTPTQKFTFITDQEVINQLTESGQISSCVRFPATN